MARRPAYSPMLVDRPTFIAQVGLFGEHLSRVVTEHTDGLGADGCGRLGRPEDLVGVDGVDQHRQSCGVAEGGQELGRRDPDGDVGIAQRGFQMREDRSGFTPWIRGIVCEKFGMVIDGGKCVKKWGEVSIFPCRRG